MSKAFTREDDLPEPPVVSRRASALPPDTQNLMTPDGAQRLRAELSHLQAEREQLLAAKDDPDHSQSSPRWNNARCSWMTACAPPPS